MANISASVVIAVQVTVFTPQLGINYLMALRNVLATATLGVGSRMVGIPRILNGGYVLIASRINIGPQARRRMSGVVSIVSQSQSQGIGYRLVGATGLIVSRASMVVIGGASPKLTMVVSEGTNLYGICSDNSIWFAVGVIPLVWNKITSVPNDEIPIWMGTTLAMLHPPPGIITQKMFIISKRGSAWSWDGTKWMQHPTPY